MDLLNVSAVASWMVSFDAQPAYREILRICRSDAKQTYICEEHVKSAFFVQSLLAEACDNCLVCGVTLNRGYLNIILSLYRYRG